ncbi:tRNA (adenosine(37)-N6)-threonylcarbamoyltransferase complex dimerization subunit type 1 TsaB [Candidatus Vondammii sp. HM_W22]|uniref:tRNA (adenosine(37)-N6)-threonylcarbamoyltransferase complex dimerization subunit type 1 TsaB n=1 Tax=Candidatus Vondammii sp. HM_W22 TaxID=2687299 RepID=UPI001F1391F4|nr:tRNA (adenosine(37)-N6)-threonylcarbamoyltransferase complex dimerization subunit type 1 TsaB [Candidatus Vondammii sp. HM_W22]
MKLLAIETASEACSVALLIDGAVTERFRVQPRGHSELILPMMNELLAEAEVTLSGLDAMAFGQGPGSFTGVRIATGVIQGAAFAADLPVMPVSTLATLAQRCFREQGKCRLLPAFDAGMKEVYWGIYEVSDTGVVRQVVADEVSLPKAVTLPEGGDWHAVGSGWKSYGEQLCLLLGGSLASINPDLLCSAHDVAVLGAADFAVGQTVSAEQALPLYLRDKVAAKPAVPPI